MPVLKQETFLWDREWKFFVLSLKEGYIFFSWKNWLRRINCKMDDIPESIDFKVTSVSGCQSKTAEDDWISREKGSQIGGRFRNGVKSNMSRSFSEGSFLDTGQSKRRFSYNSSFGMESRLRYWRYKRRLFIIFDKFSYSYIFSKIGSCFDQDKIKIVCFLISGMWLFSLLNGDWIVFRLFPFRIQWVKKFSTIVFPVDGKYDHGEWFPFLVIILNLNWSLFSFSGRRKELSLRARLRS